MNDIEIKRSENVFEWIRLGNTSKSSKFSILGYSTSYLPLVMLKYLLLVRITSLEMAKLLLWATGVSPALSEMNTPDVITPELNS